MVETHRLLWMEVIRPRGVNRWAVVIVDSLRGLDEESSYFISSHGIGQRLARRIGLLDSIRADSKESGGEAELMTLWKRGFERLLAEFYLFREAVDCVSRHYFDGHQVLLTDYAEVLGKVVGDMGKVAGAFNDTFSGTGKQERIDLEALRAKATREAAAQAYSMAAMARIEALDFMGETEAALELARRYV